jgi:type III secretion system YscD/HrpQ family protein
VNESKRFVLRILAGANAGAEAALSPRTVVGSAETADIMIADAALAPEHFTITISGDTIDVAVGEQPVALKNESRSGGTFRVAPFDLIKFGSTVCAIGPEAGAWPAFAAADLLPPGAVPAAAPAPAAEAAPAAAPKTAQPLRAAPASDQRGPAKPTAGRAPQVGRFPPASKKSRLPSLLLAAAALVLVAGLGGYWLLDQPTQATVIAEHRIQAERIAASLKANGVKILTDQQGTVIADGFVATNEQHRKLRQAFAEANLPVKYSVVSLEQQVSAVRTIISTAGAKLTVEPEPKEGKIVIEGFLPDTVHLETLQRVLKRDVAELQPLDLRISTPGTIADDTRKELAAQGLEGVTRVGLDGLAIKVSGVLGDVDHTKAKKVIDAQNAKWSPSVKIEDATTAALVTPTPVPAPAQGPVVVPATPARPKVTVVVVGKEGFVRDGSGKVYKVGDRLANGEVIVEIRMDEIITSRDGVRSRHPIGETR